MFRLNSLAIAFYVFHLVYGAVEDLCTYSRGSGRPADIDPCPSGSEEGGDSCWFYLYGRGVGRIPDKAPCPSGLRDDGISCWNDAHIYGKGCCCWWGSCCGNCRSGYNDDGCTCRKTGVGIKLTLFQRQSCRSDEDKYGALCYPKCRSGYRPFGCCICEPQGSLAGIKKISRRWRCRSDEDMYEKRCYPRCKISFNPHQDEPKCIPRCTTGYYAHGCCIVEK